MKHRNTITRMVKRAAEKALRRDANRTTCFGIFQPKIPNDLKRFKNIKQK